MNISIVDVDDALRRTDELPSLNDTLRKWLIEWGRNVAESVQPEESARECVG